MCYVNLMFLASILCFSLPFVAIILRWFINLFRKDRAVFSMPFNRSLMITSVFFVASIWFLRMAIYYYEVTLGDGCKFTIKELIFDNFIHAIKTLGIDESYVDFIPLGKKVIGKFVGENTIWQSAFGIYVMVLNSITPLVGGAIILDVLTSVFPKIKLHFLVYKKHYYFSELNERSIALAKSIMTDKKHFFSKPMMVFTDTYLDDESELSSELFIAAKKIGAVCVKDDLGHLNVFSFRKKEIFLMDEVESDNLKTLSAMCENKRNTTIKNAQIYIFYQDDAYAMIEKCIFERIKDRFEKGKINNAPVITRVKEYENLILNLLAKKPLIEPLLVEKDEYTNKNEYNLTIIGSGKIGMQMFLSSTWAGQFYGHKLNINVVSEESQEDFINELNKINPEILESTKVNSPLLKVYQEEEDKTFADPYFNLRYGTYNLVNIDLEKIKCNKVILGEESTSEEHEDAEDVFNILDSDYIFVALGSDEMNISIAEDIERKICVNQFGEDNKRKQVIVYIVYNEDFCNILADKHKVLSANVVMYPFGSVDEIYSYKNITMANEDPAAICVRDSYVKASAQAQKAAQTKRITDKLYDSLSSKARDVHLKYRIFSSFLYAKVNYSENTEWDKLTEINEDAIKIYEAEVLAENAREDILQYLTWLEHRRWNAYMRSIGFSHRVMDGKDINLKIHGCLFECAKNPIDGKSEIRKKDLKTKLAKIITDSKELKEKELIDFVISWKRLPENELIKIEDLIKEINTHFNLLNEISKEAIAVRKDCNKEIKKIERSRKDKKIKEELIFEVKEKCKSRIEKLKEQVQTEIGIFIGENDKNKDKNAKAEKLDKLDVASELRGEDMKFYDYPKDTDTKLIEIIKKGGK